MALTKVQADGINVADDFAFTGTVSGAASMSPAFQATPDAGETAQAVTASTWTKVIFGTELLDTDSMFADSRFTPTIAGYYYCWFNLQATGNTHIYTAIRLNNVSHIYLTVDGSQAGGSYVGGIINFNGSSDYIEAWTFQGTSAGTVDRTAYHTNFGGYKIIE